MDSRSVIAQGPRSIGAGSVRDSHLSTGDLYQTIYQGDVYQSVPDGSVVAPSSVDDAAAMLFAPSPPGTGGGRPAEWLRPDALVAPVQPRTETDELVQWCLSGHVPLSRLVLGAGGQGKTLLARQVCAELTGRHGWLAGFVEPPPMRSRAAGGPGQPPDWRRWAEILTAVATLPTLRVPALLVVDYAESSAGPLSALLRAAARTCAASTGTAAKGQEEAGWARILMLARHDHGWWDELTVSHPLHGWVDLWPVRLRCLTEDMHPDKVTTVWRGAVRSFAARARQNGLAAVPADAVKHAVPGQQRFETTLDLYADALVYALGSGTRRSRPRRAVRAGPPAGDPLARLLVHEDKQVRATLLAHDVRVAAEQQARAVAVVILRPAGELDEARRALHADSQLAGLGEQTIQALAAALGRLYPSADGGFWRGPTPDRLADAYILRLAEQCPSDKDWLRFLAAVAPGDSPAADGHVTMVLLRCLSSPRAAELYPRAVTRIRAFRPSLARSMERLSAALAEDGSWPDATVAAEKATNLYRELADADPDTYCPDLARSLHTLGTHLADAGQIDGLTPLEEAVRLYRRLAADTPAYRTALAVVLDDYSARLLQAADRLQTRRRPG